MADRLLHHIAFAHPALQKVLAELENDLFRRQIEKGRSADEVFVTALPRAGTTLILNLLHATGQFTTFTYRHMPFVLTPLLWNEVSRRFRQPGVERERAHGDGLTISFDSPEAFEEVVWLAHLGRKIVKPMTLSPLDAHDYENEWAEAVKAPIHKLISLDIDPNHRQAPLRYLSKNNANISRLGLLDQMFPTATFLIPFRHPLDHVTSLMKQHARFTAEHASDRFSRQYMKWLGHFEFGENFKPIDFDGWLDGKTPAPNDQDFWLRYWAAAYRYVLARKTPRIHLIDFDKLLREGPALLERLAQCVRLKDFGRLVSSGARLRAPTTERADFSNCAPENLEAVGAVHRELVERAL